jgi:hypothetical protein
LSNNRGRNGQSDESEVDGEDGEDGEVATFQLRYKICRKDPF